MLPPRAIPPRANDVDGRRREADADGRRGAADAVDEATLRARLGVPADAETVLVFGETSHWDPNWLFTSDQYYRLRIRRILDAVIEELEREPRRVFAIESLFFLQRYWQREAHRRSAIRRLVNENRLRLSGTGITTPDTVLPATEPILRDYLYGQEWLRHHALLAEPTLAYLPDDFGHSPALPSLLRALGFHHAAVTRIDGMHFIGSDYRGKGHFPLPGSSAAALLQEHETLDFVWRGPDGSEVLCHWNAFTYFQGDMLAHVGIIRWMGVVLGMPWRTRGHVARRVGSFVRQLKPLARTPYLFCPIGCDFNGPIRGLVGLLDRYNAEHYAESGVWAVCAGLDDYMTLVDYHRERLPTLDLDPNPYWMGFYASRPDIKIRCNRVARKLALAEKLGAVAAARGRPVGSGTFWPDVELQREIDDAWELLVVANHHDFITGTSPDRVWRREQGPWLEEAETLADAAIGRVRAVAPPSVAPPAREPPAWELVDGRLTVETDHVRLVLSESTGGAIERWESREDGTALLARPGNDVISYRDSGGLWRMGHEYRGGSFREADRTSLRPATLTVRERDSLLEVEVDATLDGLPLRRRLWIRRDSPAIRMQLEGAARLHRTVTVAFPTTSTLRTLAMDVPGGYVHRPHEKLYAPTFWPARSFVYLADPATGRGLAAYLGGPACAALRDDGTVEWVALRNAPGERAFGVLPIPAHPASGKDSESHVFDYAVWFTRPVDVHDAHPPVEVREVLGDRWFRPVSHDLDAGAAAVATTDRDDVLVTAVKTANRGPGLIVRLLSFARGKPTVRLHVPLVALTGARLCDARERDRDGLLSIVDGVVEVPLEGSITTVRLLLG